MAQYSTPQIPRTPARRWSAFVAATAAGVLATATAVGAATGSLPGGTPISVSITSPSAGAIVPFGSSVNLVGTAHVDASTSTPNIRLVDDLDVSGSTGDGAGGTGVSCGNPNGDSSGNTVLDCEVQALLNLNAQARAQGSVHSMGAIGLGGGGLGAGDSSIADVDPSVGQQDLVTPDASDGVNGNYVDSVLTSSTVIGLAANSGFTRFTPLNIPSGTDYEASVIKAVSLANEPYNGVVPAQKIVVIVSDGLANRGVANLPAGSPTTSGSNINGQFANRADFVAWVKSVSSGIKFITFATSGLAQCEPSWLSANGYGTLGAISEATGGACTQVNDPTQLPAAIPGLVTSTLNGLTLTVDGLGVVPSIDQTLPLTGPADITWHYTASGLQPGDHAFCATASGSDLGGAGDVTECKTITVAATSAAGPYGSQNGSTAYEGDAIPIDATLNGGATFAGWTFAPGAGVDAGSTCSFANAAAAHTTVTCTDDGTYSLTAHTTGPVDASTASLVLANANPLLGTPAFDATSVTPGTSVTLTGAFTDAGTNDTHTCSIAWSDDPGNPVIGTVNEANGSGTCTVSRTISAPGTYSASMTVRDDNNGSATKATDANSGSVTVSSLTIEPGTGSNGGYTGTEGSPVSVKVSSASGFSLSWTATPAAGNDAGSACAITNGTTDHPTFTCNDNGTYALKVTATSGSFVQTASVNLEVANANPVLSNFGANSGIVAMGSPVTVSGMFTDAGTNDTHTCTVNWDDGTPAATGTVSETNGAGTCTASRTFTTADVHTFSMTVTDDNGGSDSKTLSQYVVVYDPSAGFVTGGGTIDVGAGSYVADPTLSGKANFGFVSKYQKGATVPTGNTEFQFKTGSFSFSSDAYQWLVVSGAKAQYKGTGSVNGTAGYSFLLTATDGQVLGGGGVDKFRIKVMRTSDGSVVFDNVLGASDSMTEANPQAISSGSIVIHK